MVASRSAPLFAGGHEVEPGAEDSSWPVSGFVVMFRRSSQVAFKFQSACTSIAETSETSYGRLLAL